MPINYGIGYPYENCFYFADKGSDDENLQTVD